MTSALRYPVVLFYDERSPYCVAQVMPLRNRDTAGRLQLVASSDPGGIRARDANGRWLVGLMALEAAYRAAWAGEVSL
jgi:predicted DCC family thiol-disulfide oxidoreductase YuxK